MRRKKEASKFCTNPKCKHAGQLLPLSAFHRSAKSADKHGSWCKECANKRSREYCQQPAVNKSRRQKAKVYRRRIKNSKMRKTPLSIQAIALVFNECVRRETNKEVQKRMRTIKAILEKS